MSHNFVHISRGRGLRYVLRGRLQHTIDLINKEGYKVLNIDSTVCLEEPKMKPYTDEMRNVIAGILKLAVKDVSIKATTTEKMGFIGKGKGIMAYATVLLKKD